MKIKLYIPEFNWGRMRMIEIFSNFFPNPPEISSSASEFFSLVSQPEDSDWIVVPAFLSSLTDPNGKEILKKTSQLALQCDKPFGVFSNSDLIVDPGVNNSYLFTPGSYTSLPNQLELPAVISYDPVEKWLAGSWFPQKRPTIGFCGQATRNPLKTLKDFFKLESLRIEKKRGKSPFLHIPRFLPAYERREVLSRLSKSSLVNTDFVLRTHYKGGASTPEMANLMESEFFQNIASNMFTLCMRGMGNYSVRFYQTLAMGRIPVIIDTDGVLPFASDIKYEDFVVKVPYKDRFYADQYIVKFLKGKSTEELEQIQLKGRDVWKENFQPEGMIRNLSIQMHRLLKQKN